MCLSGEAQFNLTTCGMGYIGGGGSRSLPDRKCPKQENQEIEKNKGQQKVTGDTREGLPRCVPWAWVTLWREKSEWIQGVVQKSLCPGEEGRGRGREGAVASRPAGLLFLCLGMSRALSCHLPLSVSFCASFLPSQLLQRHLKAFLASLN